MANKSLFGSLGNPLPVVHETPNVSLSQALSASQIGFTGLSGEAQPNSVYRNDHPYLLDPNELNDLITMDVSQFTQSKPHRSRKRSQGFDEDEDVFIQETLVFTYSPEVSTDPDSPIKRSSSLTIAAKEVQQIVQPASEISKYFFLAIERLDDSQSDPEYDEYEGLFKSIMGGEYPDSEIDRILETFSMTGPQNVILNGEFLENDIRLSESVREAIEEVKQIAKPTTGKIAETAKTKFLLRYMDTAELLGVSHTVEYLLPALVEIFKQDEGNNNEKSFIKLIFANLGKLITFLSQSEITAGYNGLRDFVMTFFYDFFQSEKIDDSLKNELQPDVIDLLVKIAKLMTSEDRSEKILPIILESIRDDSDEDKRIVGLELVDKLAHEIGFDGCQNFLMYEIVSLQDDPVYRVRKETVARMINISKVLGHDIFLRILFPVYKKLSNDSIWGVRRSAVEMLPQISELCPVETKNTVLIDMFKKFSTDSSKWVKLAAFQFLGPFIASYQGIEPNPLLVDYYIHMCEQNKSAAQDNEVPYYCAYNFPAVLITLGPGSWNKLQPVYANLVKDSRWKVRRTLAYSLHEIATLLGHELAEKELLPVLNQFQNDVPEVKEGIKINLSKFLMVLLPEQREAFVDKLSLQVLDAKDWRKRIEHSKSLKEFSQIFTAPTVMKHIAPVFLTICKDEVAEVRMQGCKAVANILKSLKSSEELLATFITQIKQLSRGEKFFIRQTYIAICRIVIEKDRDIFKTYLVEDLELLSKDRVVNVRIALSMLFKEHNEKCQAKGAQTIFEEVKEMSLILKTMKEDLKCVAENLVDITVEANQDTEQESGILPEEETKMATDDSQESRANEKEVQNSAETPEAQITNETISESDHADEEKKIDSTVALVATQAQEEEKLIENDPIEEVFEARLQFEESSPQIEKDEIASIVSDLINSAAEICERQSKDEPMIE